MKRLSALLILCSLFTLTAWTYEQCVAVNFDHPDCDQYPTTTTFTDQTTTTTNGETTTTQPQVTTTSPNQTSTTVTQPEFTTVPPTTTTIQECAAGMIHQPPLCVPSTPTPGPSSTTTPDTTAGPPAELPFTGVSDLGLLALAGVSLLFLGFTAFKYGRSEE